MTASTPRVRITGLVLSPRALDGNSLDGLIAHFDAAIAGLIVVGCRLYRSRGGEMIVAGPRTEGHVTMVRFADETLRAELTDAACAIAKGFGASVDPLPAEPVD